MEILHYVIYTINEQIDFEHRTRDDFLKTSLNVSRGSNRMSVAVHVIGLENMDVRNVTPFGNENSTVALDGDDVVDEDEYIFDRFDVRAIFITLYSLVFCCCFFGNLLVILVVTLSRRLRSITNFFLANLAVADLCVGVFCVFQNLSIYLIPSWVFGDFLCKMYQFVHSLSYTASIFILVVICTERYFAIIHPITCKQILTPTRLRVIVYLWFKLMFFQQMVIVGVWMTSALYSTPKFIWVQTITNDLGDGQTETICISHRKKYDSELFDMINFGLLYVTPLCVMTILYTRIAVGLWRSANSLQQQFRHGCQSHQCTRHGEHRNIQQDQVHQNDNYKNWPVSRNDRASRSNPSTSTAAVATVHWRHRGHSRHCHLSNLSQNVLRARRGVIRMLIVLVLTFALCNLPLHARKMWQYWSVGYKGNSNFSALLTPLTFLISYFNSGINPLLYAFLSRNFRKGMKELLFCSCQRSHNIHQNKKYHNPGGPANHGSILRRSSTRSTRANCSTVTMAPNGAATGDT